MEELVKSVTEKDVDDVLNEIHKTNAIDHENLPDYMRAEIKFLNNYHSSYLHLRALTDKQRQSLISGYIRNLKPSMDPIQDIESVIIKKIFVPNNIHRNHEDPGYKSEVDIIIEKFKQYWKNHSAEHNIEGHEVRPDTERLQFDNRRIFRMNDGYGNNGYTNYKCKRIVNLVLSGCFYLIAPNKPEYILPGDRIYVYVYGPNGRDPGKTRWKFWMHIEDTQLKESIFKRHNVDLTKKPMEILTAKDWSEIVQIEMQYEFKRVTVISSVSYKTLGCKSESDIAMEWHDKDCGNILINENQELLDYKMGKKYVRKSDAVNSDIYGNNLAAPKYEMRFYVQVYNILGLNTNDIKDRIDYSYFEDRIECMIARNKKDEKEYLFVKYCEVQNVWIIVTMDIGEDSECEYEYEDLEEAFDRFVDKIRKYVEL